eukprot:TRINITY_DN8365_c0_g1_i3.p1 TRINITY_DN8365_c0_g1~~TRINITY_DN8365_c0_g1_i3.p1  ORF type:complete len:561 (-),score=84.77 TRINITY_DN8365_c0_g1_i3:86-1768(-)
MSSPTVPLRKARRRARKPNYERDEEKQLLVNWLRNRYHVGAACGNTVKKAVYADYLSSYVSHKPLFSQAVFGKILHLAFPTVANVRLMRGNNGKCQYYYKNFGKKQCGDGNIQVAHLASSSLTSSSSASVQLETRPSSSKVLSAAERDGDDEDISDLNDTNTNDDDDDLTYEEESVPTSPFSGDKQPRGLPSRSPEIIAQDKTNMFPGSSPSVPSIVTDYRSTHLSGGPSSECSFIEQSIGLRKPTTTTTTTSTPTTTSPLSSMNHGVWEHTTPVYMSNWFVPTESSLTPQYDALSSAALLNQMPASHEFDSSSPSSPAQSMPVSGEHSLAQQSWRPSSPTPRMIVSCDDPIIDALREKLRNFGSMLYHAGAETTMVTFTRTELAINTTYSEELPALARQCYQIFPGPAWINETQFPAGAEYHWDSPEFALEACNMDYSLYVNLADNFAQNPSGLSIPCLCRFLRDFADKFAEWMHKFIPALLPPRLSTAKLAAVDEFQQVLHRRARWMHMIQYTTPSSPMTGTGGSSINLDVHPTPNVTWSRGSGGGGAPDHPVSSFPN